MRAIIMRASGADRQWEERSGFARVQRQEWPPVAHQVLGTAYGKGLQEDAHSYYAPLLHVYVW